MFSTVKLRANIALVALAACLGALVPSPAANASVWPSSHQRIAEALENGDASERRSAAAKLTDLPPKLAKGLARKALRDGDIEVQLFAARAAAALGVEGAGDEVVSWLQDRDERLRVAACELIEASPTERSVQGLARVLGDGKPAVRQAAAAAMGSSGMADAVSPLLGHLDDGTVAVRLEVVRALGRIRDQRAVVPLVSKLQDQSSDVRREAARALGQLGDKRAAATLMLILQDKSVAVRVQALDAIGKLKADVATSAIAALVASESAAGAGQVGGPVQDAALRALGSIGSPQAIKLLIEALEREGPVPLDAAGRAPVREALRMAGKPAITALTAALEASPSRRLASAAALALAKVGGSAGLSAVVRATQRGAVSLDAGMVAIGELRDRNALPFVLEHIDDADVRIRQVVVEVATELLDPSHHDGRAVDVVRARVVDLTAPLGERVALVRLLGETGSPRAQQLLLTLANSKPTSLRVAVVEALGRLGIASAEVDEALLEALEAPSQRLRVAAATAIGRVGKDRAARKLLHRLGVSAEQDRGSIGIGLSGALGRSTDPKLVKRVSKSLASSPAAARDALIEGLGRMPTKEAGALLAKLAKRPEVDDRRKVAEALGRHPEAVAALRGLAGDADPTVRANAAWSLGKVGDKTTIATLQPMVEDLDVAVAGNAAVALAKVAARTGSSSAVAAPLCAALSDYRSYVRAGALVGIRFAGASCKPGVVRHLLLRDRSWRVRQAAASLLRRSAAAGKLDELGKRALIRCAHEDRDATVAARCRADLVTPKSGHDVMVYVVPDGKTAPVARAAFALVLADGSMRLGVADRRGALFEVGAPDGNLELAVPAALAP